MNYDDFENQFNNLVMAFSPIKPESKIRIYFEKFKNQDFGAFRKAVDKALVECERFPTIAKLFDIMASVNPYRGPVAAQCDRCNGLGMVSIWGHTFRARCSHGERINKQVRLAPESDWEKKYEYQRLDKEWQEIYGRPLAQDHGIRDEDIPSAS